MAEQDTTTSAGTTAPEVKRSASSGTASRRLPGLEDLAARLIYTLFVPPPTHHNPNSSRMNITPSASSASRPRLATSLLRTTSHASQSSPEIGPTDRELPAMSVLDPDGEDVGAPVVSKGAPPPRGYKNVPSLDAIAGRIKARESAKEKEAEVGAGAGAEVPVPAVAVEQVELEQGEIEQGEVVEDKPKVDLSELHPLRHKWTFYFDAKQPPPRPTGESTPVPYTPSNTESGEYEAGLNIVGKFKTVEDFCRLFNWVKPPSKLERSSNYHLFKSDIKPMWEDPANANGGKWVITMRNNPVLLDRCWSWLAMGLIGQELDDRDDIICGAVVSLRSKIDRIQLWIRQKDDVERVNAVGKRLVKLLDLEKEPGVQLEFQARLLYALDPSFLIADHPPCLQFNSDERAPASKYISIMPPQAQFRRGPETPQDNFFGSSGPGRGGGAFGAFGQGRGAFGGGAGRGSYAGGSASGGARTSTSPGAGNGSSAAAGHGRTSSLSSGA
ncbi:hypothetical protein FRC10_006152 [Ceratobasidium sp. 414]|nr:hypothetical protein FRC10_006152 [Ceratobasidium sp. 414]